MTPIAAIDREDPAGTDRDTWRAVIGYREAMDYILQRRRSPLFTISEDVLLAVHFMICQSNLAANPGQYRPGWVGVRNARTGELLHEGVDRDRLELLIGELLDYVNHEEVESVLPARGHDAPEPGDAAPVQGRQRGEPRDVSTPRYWRATGSWRRRSLRSRNISATISKNTTTCWRRSEAAHGNPRAMPSHGFASALTGHYVQARTLLRRMREVERLYAELSQLVVGNGLPERTALALLQAASGSRVRNGSYRVSADLSKNLASRDLKLLVDAGLLVPEGQKRGRFYRAAPLRGGDSSGVAASQAD